jgi:flagellar M-ring protein FliF
MHPWLKRLKHLNLQTVLLWGGTGFCLFIIGGFFLVQSLKPTFGTLFSDLETTDAPRILEQLKQLKVSYQILEDGRTILVPQEEIAKVRMELAQLGLPSGGNIGFEIFEKSDLFGTTNGVLDINYTRALEGELARSIKTIQGIQSVRVHLVVPKRELFSRDKLLPSASVVLRLSPGIGISPQQIQAIQHLVSASLPGMTFDRVAIIDNKGSLLARGTNPANELNEAFHYQQEMRSQVEAKFVNSLESLLQRILGEDQYRVEVSADLDFDRLSSTSILFDPDGQVVKNQNTTEEGSDAHESHQIDTVTIQNALPAKMEDKEKNRTVPQSKNRSANTEESINYEISNTTKNYVKEVGSIRRLSVAVMIDGIYQPKADGSLVYSPRSDEDIEKITQLIKTAIGFREDRGDLVKVINLPFSHPLKMESEFKPSANSLELDRSFGTRLRWVLGGVGILLMFLIGSRQISKLWFRSSSQSPTASSPLPPEPSEEVKFSSPVQKMQHLIDQDPEKAVSIFRNWMYSNRNTSPQKKQRNSL